MAVRATMANLISRVRVLTNDTLPLGSGQIFTDQDVQNVMDETRLDVQNLALRPVATYSGSSVQYLDYYSDPGMGNWEDDLIIKQYRTILTTPTTIEPIVGHFTYSTTTLPPLYIYGKSYDCYRAAADLLERWAAKWVLLYSFTSDSQSFQRSQATDKLLKLAHSYRAKQRALTISLARADIAGGASGISLKATETDYIARG